MCPYEWFTVQTDILPEPTALVCSSCNTWPRHNHSIESYLQTVLEFKQLWIDMLTNGFEWVELPYRHSTPALKPLSVTNATNVMFGRHLIQIQVTDALWQTHRSQRTWLKMEMSYRTKQYPRAFGCIDSGKRKIWTSSFQLCKWPSEYLSLPSAVSLCQRALIFNPKCVFSVCCCWKIKLLWLHSKGIELRIDVDTAATVHSNDDGVELKFKASSVQQSVITLAVDAIRYKCILGDIENIDILVVCSFALHSDCFFFIPYWTRQKRSKRGRCNDWTNIHAQDLRIHIFCHKWQFAIDKNA